MPQLTTFGFEAEFQQNAADVMAGLHAIGLTAERRLHSYHCDCDSCSFGNGFPFRGQTDSSCSGEIISDIFGGTDDYDSQYSDPTRLMQQLAEVAIDVDAEPGLGSGFHVHVGVSHLAPATLHAAFFQFLRWEQVLARIAGGRWPDQRANVNRTARECMNQYFADCFSGGQSITPGRLDAALSENSFITRDLFNAHLSSDRHSNLNTGQRRAPTWEFRLWNSTRVAWRMELFTGLSVALVDPAVIARLATMAPPLRRRTPDSGISSVVTACDDAGHARTAHLLDVQAEYLRTRAATAPVVLTAV